MQFLVTMERPPLIRQNMLKHSTETTQAKPQRHSTTLLCWKWHENYMKICPWNAEKSFRHDNRKGSSNNLHVLFTSFKVMIQKHLQGYLHFISRTLCKTSSRPSQDETSNDQFHLHIYLSSRHSPQTGHSSMGIKHSYLWGYFI